ncbi:ADP-ribosylglycohydrolase family protein [Arthrobacter sp. zg-Y877]|uniref:ADP-ribosylglycohydrolase family protein n=1 Tax=Arthrobacter sp. zg-Y877 TaxID=3049074 RepID=UPI0025A47010|nr:ADP-ribosylglycohydrolase family protein [Arthrobacter sp. zg-Y877]MDM7989685.1 ADP-ribosylglycohydrolase family protein [Arthrobacter sp. zg-Y877]
MSNDPRPAPVSPSAADLAAKIRGCLLGGALGDAAATAAGSPTGAGTSISANTQLALYSLDGLLEAIEWANEGVGADETACLWLAYLRWMRGQGLPLPESGPSPLPRPIDSEPLLQAAADGGPSGPDGDVLAALSTGEMGTRQRPVNTGVNTPAALVRSAPFGLLPYVETETVYKLALDAASLTHGHSSARHSAAVFASMIHGLLAPGATLRSAAEAALEHANANGAVELAGQVQAVLNSPAGPTGTDGAGHTAEDALLTGLRAALAAEKDAQGPSEDRAAATTTAVQQAAAAGGAPAAIVAGSLLGTLFASLPEASLDALRERSVIEKLASGFIAATIAP